MPFIKQLDLLKEVSQRHQQGVIRGEKKSIVYELGGKDFRSPQMLELLKQYWQPVKEDILYIIDFAGIDVLTPSAAKIIVESVPDLSAAYKVPILFTNVRQEVRKSLDREASNCDPVKMIWVVDESKQAELIGKIPNKLRELLGLLKEQGEANASTIAEMQQNSSSKKAIGNISVYLQKLFNAGLVGRTKVTALERQDAERGWTYSYFTAPTIERKSEPEDYERMP